MSGANPLFFGFDLLDPMIYTGDLLI